MREYLEYMPGIVIVVGVLVLVVVIPVMWLLLPRKLFERVLV